ncbi:MAG: hypothetical protein EBZ47_02880 [Chlamydiae bacterium]|nr:hypothetical protein [Chlamydiota bacterium]
MSHKTRLKRLEKIALGDTLWALIGIGKPRDTQHQRQVEARARDNFYTSGGDREAYLAFLPFDCFADGFIGYIKRSQIGLMITNKTKNPAEN